MGRFVRGYRHSARDGWRRIYFRAMVPLRGGARRGFCDRLDRSVAAWRQRSRSNGDVEWRKRLLLRTRPECLLRSTAERGGAARICCNETTLWCAMTLACDAAMAPMDTLPQKLARPTRVG